MPPQERPPTLEEIVARMKAKQQEQKKREEQKLSQLIQSDEKAKVRDESEFKIPSLSSIKPFNPEKDIKDGKSIAGDQGEDK